MSDVAGVVVMIKMVLSVQTCTVLSERNALPYALS
jgi:hypothetical protein